MQRKEGNSDSYSLALARNRKLIEKHGDSFRCSSINSDGAVGFVNRVLGKLTGTDPDIVAFFKGYENQEPDGL